MLSENTQNPVCFAAAEAYKYSLLAARHLPPVAARADLVRIIDDLTIRATTLLNNCQLWSSIKVDESTTDRLREERSIAGQNACQGRNELDEQNNVLCSELLFMQRQIDAYTRALGEQFGTDHPNTRASANLFSVIFTVRTSLKACVETFGFTVDQVLGN